VRKDIGDPREFVLAVAWVPNKYSEEIIRNVTDPAVGLPGRLRYPLEIADVEKACFAAKISHEIGRPRRDWSESPQADESAEQEELARRGREGPPWSAVIGLIKEKSVRAIHNRANKLFGPGSFDEGILTIIVSKEAIECASRFGPYVKIRFPEVTEVRFIETKEAA
jgi:hypothetical protein